MIIGYYCCPIRLLAGTRGNKEDGHTQGSRDNSNHNCDPRSDKLGCPETLDYFFCAYM